MPRLLHRVYKEYPKIIEAIQNRYKIYNETMDDIEKKEKEGKVFVIRPTEPLKVGRIERRPDRLSVLYDQGLSEAKKRFTELERFLGIRLG